MVFAEGEVTRLKLYYLNRNVAIFGFYLWPALLAMRTFRDANWRWVVSSLFIIAATVSIFISEHQSSQVGLIGSVIVFILASRWSKATVKGIAAVWCLAFVLALPVALLTYKAELNTARWLPVSFRDRIAIWDDTAERALKDPWFGIGARSTRVLMNEPIFDEPTNSVRLKSAGWHAHDLFLQTWYELGVVGVMLIGIAGAAVMLRIAVLSDETQPFAAAAFTFFMAIAAFAWDMWQTWLVCAIALALLYLNIAAKNFDAAKQT
jgi:O-antigen ligase